MLYERGYKRDQILSLFRYIDWMMALPKFLEQRLETTISDYEEAHNMPFMTYPERKGYQRGIKDGKMEGLDEGIQIGITKSQQEYVRSDRETVIEILMIRFGKLSDTFVEAINKIEQLAVLRTLLKQAAIVDLLTKFEAFLTEPRSAA